MGELTSGLPVRISNDDMVWQANLAEPSDSMSDASNALISGPLRSEPMPECACAAHTVRPVACSLAAAPGAVSMGRAFCPTNAAVEPEKAVVPATVHAWHVSNAPDSELDVRSRMLCTCVCMLHAAHTDKREFIFGHNNSATYRVTSWREVPRYSLQKRCVQTAPSCSPPPPPLKDAPQKGSV